MTTEIEELCASLRNYKPFRLGGGKWFGPKVCERAAANIKRLASENEALLEAIRKIALQGSRDISGDSQAKEMLGIARAALSKKGEPK